MNRNAEVVVTCCCLMAACCRWLSSRDIEAVSSAAGRCLLCQQSNTLILFEAKDVLDHTQTHTSTRAHPLTFLVHQEPRCTPLVLFSFALTSYIKCSVRCSSQCWCRSLCFVSVTHTDCNLTHFSCTPSTTIQVYTVDLNKAELPRATITLQPSGVWVSRETSRYYQCKTVHGGFIKRF